MIERQGCPEWLTAVSAYLDGVLAVEEEQRVHAHLRACPGCAEQLVDLVPVVQTLRSLPPVAPPRDLWPELARTLRSDPAFQAGTTRVTWVTWRGPLLGVAAVAVVAGIGFAATSSAYRAITPAVPVADVDTYWHAHDAFDQDQGLPTRYAPDLDAVEASYQLEP